MSVWKDIRCDVNGPECWDNRNGGPQGFQSAGELRKLGRSWGWTTRPGVGDICPSCRKVPSGEG